MRKVDYFIKIQSLSGRPDECGDTGIVKTGDDQCFLALVDGLGHGTEAHYVADLARNYLSQNYEQNLIKVMNGLHDHLKNSRGAVAALCRLDTGNGMMNFVGIGNICARVYSIDKTSLISRDGVIGYNIPCPKDYQTTLSPGDILILASDGLTTHFQLEEYPGLLSGSAKNIAAKLFTNLYKGDDDASCIVLRYGI